MKHCDNKHRWNLDFDALSDEEFEELLAHADSCEAHSNLLDDYNKCLVPLIKEAMPARILSADSERITLSGVWIYLLNLKLQKAFGSFSRRLDWKLALVSLFLGALFILSIGREFSLNGENLKLIEQPLILIAQIFAVGFLIFIVSRKFKGFSFASANEIPAMSMLSVDTYADTSFFVKPPEKQQPPNLTVEEKAISAELKKIISSGFTVDNCRKGLEFLQRNENIVNNSWMNTLNKAKLLIGTGERDEPRKIIGAVLEEYSGSREAVGSAYEALSWLEEVEYNEEGKTDPQKLERRINYINKGLQFYPGYYLLWIDAFEVACLKKNTAAAIVSLNKVIEIDKESAKQYFLDSPMTEEIKKLGLKLKMKIACLIMGRKIVKKLRPFKMHGLIVALLIALSVPAILPKVAVGIQFEGAISKLDAGGIQRRISKDDAGGLQRRIAKDDAGGLQKANSKNVG